MVNSLIKCPKCHHEFEPAEGFKSAVQDEIDQAVNAQLKLRSEQQAQEIEARLVQENQLNQAKNQRELEQQRLETARLKAQISEQEDAINAANQAHAEALKKEREVKNERSKIDLTVEERLADKEKILRAEISDQESQRSSLKIAEYEEKIRQSQKANEDLRRKLEQGSQQIQGEALEVVLEDALSTAFLTDEIEPIKTGGGKSGADVLQHIDTKIDRSAGVIIWESKNTQNWGNDWIEKIKNDQHSARADLAVISSQTLPPDIDKFGRKQGVWVCAPQYAVLLSAVLREQIVQVKRAHNLEENRHNTAQMIYDYLIGSEFRHRVERVVEAFTSMKEDLDKERRAAMKSWAKREKQIETVIVSTTGLYGDLQGIAGGAIMCKSHDLI